MKPEHIRVISICLFSHDDRLLVFEGFDSLKKTRYYRPLGGGVHPGETSSDAVRREIREELGLEIADLELVGTLENIFELDGAPGHEIVFVYDGRFLDESVYGGDAIDGVEEDGTPFKAVWRPLDSFSTHERLVPERLEQFLDTDPDVP